MQLRVFVSLVFQHYMMNLAHHFAKRLKRFVFNTIESLLTKFLAARVRQGKKLKDDF